MAELYTINIMGSGIGFESRSGETPEYAKASRFDPQKAPKDIALVCRMGSPDLAHCVIFRQEGKPGGVFAMHEQDQLLFVAIAESELAYALAKGFFGNLAASARYGVDIFEATDGEDD